MTLLQRLQQIGRPRILVLGDLMLDHYTWGNATRISPEAPVLVLQADRKETRLGGAASVAAVARALDAEVSVAGIVGDDGDGLALRSLLDEARIDHGLVFSAPFRPTSTKERFVGRAATRHPHQILRVDRETCEPIGPKLEKRLTRAIVDRLREYQAVLVSDYDKGVCTPRVLAAVIGAANAVGVPVLVDPARIADYGRYRNATCLKPNRNEAALASEWKIVGPEDAMIAARRIRETCRAAAVVVTLDSQGMVLCCNDGAEQVVPSHPRDVYDITGAGDVALATLGLGCAAGVPLSDAVRLANIASGLEVERLGVVPVLREEIHIEVLRTERDHCGKLVSRDDMEALAESYRRRGQTVVFTNGCFDLLHVGHTTCLEEASRLGDILVVAANSDRSIQRLKAPGRPVICQQDRIAMLSALQCVDHVLVLDDDSPRELLRRIRPDVLVKGGTYTAAEVVGCEIVQEYGGKVCVTERVNGTSTTDIVARIKAVAC